MKSLVVLFFGMLLWTQQAFASRASVSFYTRSAEKFQVVLDGRLINRYPSDKIRLNDVPAGYHAVEIRFPDRYGVLVHRARLYLEPGYEAEYRVQLNRRRRIEMQKVGEYPINGGIVPPYAGNPRPRPLPDYRDRDSGGDYDGRYDRDDRDGRNYPDDRYGRNDPYNNRDCDCRDLLQGADFERFYRTVADRSSDDSKLALTRQVLRQSGIYAEDLKRLMKLFSFESNKVDLAKFAYNQVCDRRNFYVVYDALSFDSSIRELERFTSNQ